MSSSNSVKLLKGAATSSSSARGGKKPNSNNLSSRKGTGRSEYKKKIVEVKRRLREALKNTRRKVLTSISSNK